MVNLYLQKPNYLTCSFVFALIFWLDIVLFQTYQWINPNQISKFIAQLEFPVHMLTLVITFFIFRKINQADRRIIQWFVLANVCLFLNDLIFYFSVYFPNNNILSPSALPFIFGYTPYVIWLSSIIIFLSKILSRDIFNFFQLSKILPFLFLINLLITFLFFSSIHYAFLYFSWESISHILSFMGEFIIFDFAILCLIYSENRGISLILLGVVTLISGDLFVNYSFLSQTNTLLHYGEYLWFLGLIFIMCGVLTIRQNESYCIAEWFSRTNTIKNRLAFWSFGTSILSFLLFFIIAYFFSSSINQQLLLGLPLFVMMYSIIVVIFSIYMGKSFEAPFKKLTANVEALMLKNDKSKVDDTFSTQEFIFLQKFIVDSFDFKEKKNRDQQEMLKFTAQIAHDIRSPLAAINIVISDVMSIPENKRIIIKNAAIRINDLANNLLLQSKNNFSYTQRGSETQTCPELIFVVLENMVSEKRCEYQNHNINIELISSGIAINSFSDINLQSFKRVISNLINNSIDACKNSGLINITLNCSDSHIEIVIQDNGCGIPGPSVPATVRQN